MTKHNARNERVKREYLTFLKEAKRLNEASIDGVARRLMEADILWNVVLYRRVIT